VSAPVWRRLQFAAACCLIAAYAALSHYCNTGGAGRLGAALALAPLLAVGGTLLWRSTRPLIAVPTALAAAALLYDWWPVLEKNFSVVYLLQECGMYGLLAFGFAATLRVGETALCTRLADKLHGPLTPAEVRYTRRVTLAWALFFAAIMLATMLLYVSAPLSLWSMFVNFATVPLMAAMFAGEYAVRARVLPHTNRRGILATVRVFFTSR
jgi:uncharacterized membrane protein